MYKKYYSRFLENNAGIQHFACHSHYYWPDVTRSAMIEYWDDSAKYVDAKWSYFFTEKIPLAQKYIAKVLNTSKPQQIVFAPNTHEFIVRLLSCFHPQKPLKILSTDSEFHSFSRQISRLNEFDHISLTTVNTLPSDTFEERFIEEIRKNKYDMIFFSHVFFSSGIAIQDLAGIVNAVDNPECMIVVDGYHAFMSIETDIRSIENRIFYFAGSYKYAQGGEGCCFMHVPEKNQYRPWNTGWFADFESLENNKNTVIQYAADGMKFSGATMDFSALYRLISVFRWLENENIRLSDIRTYIQKMQQLFLDEIDKYDHPLINRKRLLINDLGNHGHFFSFKFDTVEQVEKMHKLLNEYKIITDYRLERLRFGFALYHDGNYDLSVLNTRRAYFFDEFIFN